MSHPEQREFISSVRRRFPGFFRSTRVLEVGSLNINGSVRDFFHDCDYLGVDLGPGPGVDLVSAGEDLTFPDNSFDVCISTECFEHNPAWRETFANMCRMSRGLVLVTAASDGRPEHGTRRTTPEDSPFTVRLHDYYANVSRSDFELLGIDLLFVRWGLETNSLTHDIYFWGAVRMDDTDRSHEAFFPDVNVTEEGRTSRVLAVTVESNPYLDPTGPITFEPGVEKLSGYAVSLAAEVEDLRKHVAALEGSRIWRLSSPYRAWRSRLRRRILAAFRGS